MKIELFLRELKKKLISNLQNIYLHQPIFHFSGLISLSMAGKIFNWCNLVLFSLSFYCHSHTQYKTFNTNGSLEVELTNCATQFFRNKLFRNVNECSTESFHCFVLLSQLWRFQQFDTLQMSKLLQSWVLILDILKGMERMEKI